MAYLIDFYRFNSTGDPSDKNSIKKICGRESSRDDNFKRAVIKAMDELLKDGAIAAYKIYKSPATSHQILAWQTDNKNSRKS